jgi:hypothetical protein
MHKRGLKVAAMVLSGGVLLQYAGCGYLLADQLASAFVSSFISALIQAILGTAGTTP